MMTVITTATSMGRKTVKTMERVKEKAKTSKERVKIVMTMVAVTVVARVNIARMVKAAAEERVKTMGAQVVLAGVVGKTK